MDLFLVLTVLAAVWLLSLMKSRFVEGFATPTHYLAGYTNYGKAPIEGCARGCESPSGYIHLPGGICKIMSEPSCIAGRECYRYPQEWSDPPYFDYRAPNVCTKLNW